MDKIICVGKNYLDHAKELGDAVPEAPVVFLKPPSVLAKVDAWGQRLVIPEIQPDCHHEVEIVISVGRGGYKLSLEEAGACIEGLTLGLDMTLRQVQSQLKQAGHPWTVAKVFPYAAIIGPIEPLSNRPGYLEQPFSLSIGGQVKQRAQGKEMSFNPVQLIAYISQFFPLVSGDLIFTGTPAGVGPVARGDIVRVSWGESDYYDVKWMD